MTLHIDSKLILKGLHLLSWIIFIGLCIESGGILFNTGYALYKPVVARYFWNGADLSALYNHDKGHFITQTSLMLIAALMKTLIFYLLVRLFYDKKFSLAQPFNAGVTDTVFKIAWLCLGAGAFSHWGVRYAAWLETQGIAMPDIDSMRIGGADVWLFMAVVLFVIGQVFKKGMALQLENDLTV